MDPADVEERLDALEHVHVFVKRVKEHEFPDFTLSLQYQFVHVLYQNALYASLQPTRRAALSGRVARVARRRITGASTRAIAGRLAALFEVGARLRHERAVLPRGGASRRRACSRFARRCRSPSAGWRPARDAGGPRAPAARARAADDPRAGAADDEGLGEPGDRAGLRPRPRTVPSARRRAAAVPRPLGDRAVPRDQGRPAPVPQPRRRADGGGGASRQSRVPHGRASPARRLPRVRRRHRRSRAASSIAAASCTTRNSIAPTPPCSGSTPA